MSVKEDCSIIEFGYGFKTNNNERGFSRGNYIQYQELRNYVNGRSGYSTFCSAYRYSNIDIDKADLYGSLYLDFDDVNNFENVRQDALQSLSYIKVVYKIDPKYLQIFFSGNKGIHIIIPASYLGIEPMPLLNGVFKSIAMSIKTYSPNKTIDTQIYDNKRLFRIPNTQHEKSNLFKIPITIDELNNLSENEIRELAKQPRAFTFNKMTINNPYAIQRFQKNIQEYYILDKETRDSRNRHGSVKINFVPPCIQYILENGALEGQRNISIACLSSFYKSFGKSLNETLELIIDWNSKNLSPTPKNELIKTVNSLYNNTKRYGCSTLKQISNCNENQCAVNKRKKKREVINNETR